MPQIAQLSFVGSEKSCSFGSQRFVGKVPEQCYCLFRRKQCPYSV